MNLFNMHNLQLLRLQLPLMLNFLPFLLLGGEEELMPMVLGEPLLLGCILMSYPMNLKQRLLVSIVIKKYRCDSKSHGTSNMLAHSKVCHKNPALMQRDPRQTNLTSGEGGFLV